MTDMPNWMTDAELEMEAEYYGQYDYKRELFAGMEDIGEEYIPTQEEVDEMRREHDAFNYLMAIYPLPYSLAEDRKEGEQCLIK